MGDEGNPDLGGQMRKVRTTLLLLLISCGAYGAAPFDSPVKIKRVDLGITPDIPSNGRAKVSCFYFESFMVKEVDLREKGAAQLSILPIAKGAKYPSCAKENIPGEMVIPGDQWSGYFKGVKSYYVFFDPDDGYNGATGFAVFDARSGKKLFEDDTEDGVIRSITLEGSAIKLHYRRAFRARCSILKDGMTCWASIRDNVTTHPAPMPDCLAAFHKEHVAMAKDNCRGQRPGEANCIQREIMERDNNPEWLSSQAMIGYNVEAVYDGSKLNFTPREGPLSCWHTD